MDLTISVDKDSSGRAVLGLEGALDLQSRAALLDVANAAREVDGVTGLLLDLSGLDFIDSTGLGAIVGLAGEADEAGLTFALRDPSARARRILEVTGLLGAWPIEISAV
jgi:anti-anti-sigma factor